MHHRFWTYIRFQNLLWNKGADKNSKSFTAQCSSIRDPVILHGTKEACSGLPPCPPSHNRQVCISPPSSCPLEAVTGVQWTFSPRPLSASPTQEQWGASSVSSSGRVTSWSSTSIHEGTWLIYLHQTIALEKREVPPFSSAVFRSPGSYGIKS